MPQRGIVSCVLCQGLSQSSLEGEGLSASYSSSALEPGGFSSSSSA
eukprot:CAMPEP_0115336232 /NCGR_PEP_ID=MMETSP0270-20121206/88898_1 /TAXON_ID=71861 /ORGANISM="Scrippsiella trochoidea, Strain CCMP3099" /LENGTH=45 /DNA_ID= /DNA_START= /DNA_END= /DNA_ORIENTATION=